MSKRITSGIVAGIAMICVAVPAAGLADRGGQPHAKKACKMHRHSGRHEGFTRGRGHHRGFGHGKKCGFPGNGQTGPTGNTDQTGMTGPTGDRDDQNGRSNEQGENHSHGHEK